MFNDISRDLKIVAKIGSAVFSVVNVLAVIGIFYNIVDEFNISGAAKFFVVLLIYVGLMCISYGFCGLLYAIAKIVDHLESIDRSAKQTAIKKNESFNVVYSSNVKESKNSNQTSKNDFVDTNNASVNKTENANTKVTVVHVENVSDEVICPICKQINKLKKDKINKCFYCGTFLNDNVK